MHKVEQIVRNHNIELDYSPKRRRFSTADEEAQPKGFDADELECFRTDEQVQRMQREWKLKAVEHQMKA